MTPSQRLPNSFYRSVQADLGDRIGAAGLDAMITDDPQDVAYLTGFFHHPHERPVAALVHADGDTVVLVPELEREHALDQNIAADLACYAEYPGTASPWIPLTRCLRPGGRRVGHPAGMAVGRHHELGALLSPAALVGTGILRDQRSVKRPEEIELHRRAAAVTDRMLLAGRAIVEQAVAARGPLPSEAELAAAVTTEGVSIMYAEHVDVVVVSPLAGGLVYTGANSARPHRLPSADRLRVGEPFMLSLGCAVGGRFVEGERTFFLGEPDQRQAAIYDTVLRAHAAGAATIGPGRHCREVDAAGRQVMAQAGLEGHRRHRQGHGIGLDMHEPPWLEDGDDTELAAGMIVSNEPGLYVPGLAGFRISDSMLVTPDGCTPLTHYPRTLDDVLIAA